MRTTSVRSSLFIFAAVGSLAVAAACSGGGGGGGSSMPGAGSAVPAGPSAAPLTAASISPNTTQVVNFTGPGAKVTVSIRIPRKAGQPQSLMSESTYHALYGSRAKDRNLRTMAQTSPTSKIRTAGARQFLYTRALEKSTGRLPQYVSSATNYMEFVVSDNLGNIDVDEVAYCGPNVTTCTGSFDAPAGTGYTLTLFLYDYCSYLLSAGSLTNQTITVGTNNPFTITLNGVVDHFFMTTTPTVSPYGNTGSGNLDFYQGLSFTQAFTMTLLPMDADNDEITNITTPPSVLMDDNFYTIASVNVTPQFDAANAGFSPLAVQNVPIPADPTLLTNSVGSTPIPYNWDGTGTTCCTAEWVAAPVEGAGPLVPTAVTSPAAFTLCGGLYGEACNGIQFAGGSSYLYGSITAAGMNWENTQNIIVNGNPSGSFYGGGGWNLELAAPPTTPPVVYTLGVEDNIPYYTTVPGSNQIALTFTDGLGLCAAQNILNPLPSTVTAGNFNWPVQTVNLSIDATTNGSCVLSVSDNYGNASLLNIFVNNPSVTISGGIRK